MRSTSRASGLRLSKGSRQTRKFLCQTQQNFLPRATSSREWRQAFPPRSFSTQPFFRKHPTSSDDSVRSTVAKRASFSRQSSNMDSPAVSSRASPSRRSSSSSRSQTDARHPRHRSRRARIWRERLLQENSARALRGHPRARSPRSDAFRDATHRADDHSLLFTGAFSYRLDSGETETLDYGTVTPIVPATKWDATSGSDPLGDLQTAVNQIVAASGLMPDTLVLGSNVMSVFLSHPQVIDVLNKLDVSGAIQPSKPTPGTSPRRTRLSSIPRSFGLREARARRDPRDAQEYGSGGQRPTGLQHLASDDKLRKRHEYESDGQIQTYADLKFVPRQLSEPRQEYHGLRIATRPCLNPFDLSSWAVINPLT